MSARCFVFVLIAWLAVPAFAASKDPTEYATLLATLKAGNTGIDYTRLRLSYVDSPESKKAQDTSKAEKAMFAALEAKDFPAALKEAQTVLASEYISIDAHYVASEAHRNMGETDKAEFHDKVFRGLIESIHNSGDGKSPSTAWVVISVDEEYVMLRALGCKPSSQSLLAQNGHSYDVMKCTGSDDGKEHTLYFNADIPLAHEF
jgi:hypothetical protein